MALSLALAGCSTGGMLSSPAPSDPTKPRIYLPRGGMQSQPVGTTDVFLIDGHIQTQVEGSELTSGSSGRGCVQVGQLMRCE